MRRYGFAALLIIPLVALGSTLTASADDRPNILFIMSDDHAYQAISAYDASRNKTPNIDRLAKEGMRFDRAFVTNSICGPSRAARNISHTSPAARAFPQKANGLG